MSSTRFEDRLDSLIVGTATQEDADELSGLLRDDPELRKRYRSQLALHADLLWVFREEDIDTEDGLLAPLTNRSVSFRRIAIGLASAAAIALISVGMLWVSSQSAHANAATVLRQSMPSLSEATSRRYEIAELEPADKTFKLKAELVSGTNGFTVRVEREGTTEALRFGRSEPDQTWIAFGDGIGMTINDEEAGPRLKRLIQFYGLNLESIFSELLAHHRLRIIKQDEKRTTIASRNTRPLGSIRSTVISVNRQTQTIEGMVFRRRQPDGSLSTVRLRMVESVDDSIARFDLTSQPSPVARILRPSDRPDRRRLVLRSQFGNQASQWLIESNRED